ncbi:hypothetical protein [Bradyrhizobium lablabi]|uniref:hypothetical protein n=1 Tax=Bradyrhizobium lablabi TaxID=722472 RepID=UPI000B02A975|nr:hypothetical protein [Bradyrhizobium lablabi]
MREWVSRVPKIAWNSRVGLFHCMAEDDESKTVKQSLAQARAAGENSDDNNQ